MPATVERLCRHVFVVRGGTDTTGPTSDWNERVVGLIVPWWKFWTYPRGCVIGVAGVTLGIKPELQREMIRASNLFIRLPVWWKRLGEDGPFWLRQVSGLDGKSRIRMAKEALHSKHPAKDSDGTFKTDPATVTAIATAYMAAFAAGQIKVLGISEVNYGNGLFARTLLVQE